MADRRPDEQSTAPSPPQAKPQAEAPRPEADRPETPQPDLTQRIHEAYASSAPIVPDEARSRRGGTSNTPAGESEDTQPGRLSSGDRFAAVLAATTGKMRENATPGTSTQPTAAVRGATAKGAAPTRPGSTAGPRPAPRVRKARLRLTHVDPWSVMKTAFLLSIALGIVIVVAVAIVWSVLGAADVWGSIDKAVNDVLGDTSTPFRIEEYLGMSRVMGFTLIVAVADVILITVIATLGAFLYNLAAALLGGLEVVLAEEDR